MQNSILFNLSTYGLTLKLYGCNSLFMVLWFLFYFCSLLSLIAILIFDSIFNKVAEFSDGCNGFKSLVYQFLTWKVLGCKVFNNYDNANVVLFTALKILQKNGYSLPVFRSTMSLYLEYPSCASTKLPHSSKNSGDVRAHSMTKHSYLLTLVSHVLTR